MCTLPKRQNNITTTQIYRYEPLACRQPPKHCCNHGNSLTNKQVIVTLFHAINCLKQKFVQTKYRRVLYFKQFCLCSSVIKLGNAKIVFRLENFSLLFVYLESVAVCESVL